MTQSTYLRNQDANWVKGTAYPAAPTVYITLHTADPALTGANELAFNARIAVSVFGAITTVGNTREMPVNETITFTNAPSTGTAPYWGAWDSLTGGNFLGGGIFVDDTGTPDPITFSITESVVINEGTIRFAYAIDVFSIYFVDAKLNWLAGTAMPTAPTNIYAIAGFNLTMTTGTEAVLPRELVSWGSIITIGAYKRIRNSVDLVFDSLTEPPLSFNSLRFYDAITAGNLLFIGRGKQKNYTVGQQPSWLTTRINVDF
jgi:hypothetical protein